MKDADYIPCAFVLALIFGVIVSLSAGPYQKPEKRLRDPFAPQPIRNIVITYSQP